MALRWLFGFLLFGACGACEDVQPANAAVSRATLSDALEICRAATDDPNSWSQGVEGFAQAKMLRGKKVISAEEPIDEAKDPALYEGMKPTFWTIEGSQKLITVVTLANVMCHVVVANGQDVSLAANELMNEYKSKSGWRFASEKTVRNSPVSSSYFFYRDATPTEDGSYLAVTAPPESAHGQPYQQFIATYMKVPRN